MKTSSVTALLLLASSASANSIRVDRSRIWAQVQAAEGKKRDKRAKQQDMKECDVSPDTEVSDSSSDSDVYTFKLNRIDAHCIDEDGKEYQYGEFKDVEDYKDCAKMCVKDPDSELLEDLVGFEWDCDDEKCRCLYHKDALDDDNDSSFDVVETGDSYDGDGPVKKKEGGKEDNDWFCAKLKTVTSASSDVASERALRGHS